MDLQEEILKVHSMDKNLLIKKYSQILHKICTFTPQTQKTSPRVKKSPNTIKKSASNEIQLINDVQYWDLLNEQFYANQRPRCLYLRQIQQLKNWKQNFCQKSIEDFIWQCFQIFELNNNQMENLDILLYCIYYISKIQKEQKITITLYNVRVLILMAFNFSQKMADDFQISLNDIIEEYDVFSLHQLGLMELGFAKLLDYQFFVKDSLVIEALNEINQVEYDRNYKEMEKSGS